MTRKVLLVGAPGTIGTAVAAALAPRYEVIPASRKRAAHPVDITDMASVRRLFAQIGPVDAVVCAAGDARFKPLHDLEGEDYVFSLRNKLMGQVNLTRVALEQVADGGSITLTAGILARAPMPGSAAISIVNAGLEGFARAAALEAPRGIRVNVVSPPWVSETLAALKMTGVPGKPAAVVAQAYVRSIEGTQTGAVIEP